MVEIPSATLSNKHDTPTSNRLIPSGGTPVPLSGFPSIGRGAPTSSNTGKPNVVAGVIVPPLFLVASFFGATTDVGSTIIAHEYSTLARSVNSSNRSSENSTSERNEINSKNDISKSLTTIHSTSGLTWEEISYLLGVSRRAVHNWLNGSRVSSKNARNLANLHKFFQKIDQGDSASTRAYLLAPRESGATLYESAMTAAQVGRSTVELAFAPGILIAA